MTKNGKGKEKEKEKISEEDLIALKNEMLKEIHKVDNMVFGIRREHIKRKIKELEDKTNNDENSSDT